MPHFHRPSPPMGFVGNRIDRVDHIRGDPSALRAAFADPAARVLRLNALDPVVDGDTLARDPLAAGSSVEDHILLGVEDDGPLFVWLDPDVPHGARQNDGLWAACALLSPDEMALYGGARSLVDWHARHGFCAACGGRTAPDKGGWSRRCGECAAEHFPRVDPVVMMLAEHDGRVLIGRQHRWPPGRYSALAGFLEPGETIEDAVIRELREEAGVVARDVRYALSQPWPFPSTLMIACTARVDDPTLHIDTNELEHAMWVDARAVRAALDEDPAAPFLSPLPRAIAYHILAHWLSEQGD